MGFDTEWLIAFNKRTKTNFDHKVVELTNDNYLVIVEKPSNTYEVLIDKKGLDILKGINRTLQIDSRGYPYITLEDSTKQVFLHALFGYGVEYYNEDISERPLIDHINGDRLDNRRCNLRIAKRSENAQNARIRKDNSVGIKGFNIGRKKNRPLWIIKCRIQDNHNRIFAEAPLCEEGLKYLIIWNYYTRKELHNEFCNFGRDYELNNLRQLINEMTDMFVSNLSDEELRVYNNNGYSYTPRKFKKHNSLEKLKDKFKDVDLDKKIS